MSLPTGITEALSKLQGKAKAWQDLSNLERAAVARECRKTFATFDKIDSNWIHEDLKVLGIDSQLPDSTNYAAFNPFLFVSTVGERLDKVADMLEGKLKDQATTPVRTLPEDGPKVYAMGALGAAARGCKLEVWSAGAKGLTNPPEAGNKNGVSLVLGAGNQNFLTAVDIIERAFVHKEVVLLKNHPIRPHMVAPFKHVFAPLEAWGAFAQCNDSDLNGAHGELIAHPSICHIHMTGAGATHDKIMATLKKAGRQDTVGFTSELGCITPWIVCPGVSNDGKWTDAEIEHHAGMLSACFKANCSMNCLSPKLLALPSAEIWPQREQFLTALKKKLAEIPNVPPYYPGAHQRYAAFEKEYKDAVKIESPPNQEDSIEVGTGVHPGQDFTRLPALLVEVGTVGAADCRSYALKNEAFAPVLAIGTVKSSSRKDFPLDAAAAVNQHVFGTLSCSVIVPDGDVGPELDKMIEKLNYGAIGLNVFTGLGYGNPLGVWGGAPGSYKKDDPCSGLDFIGNYAGVERISKAVFISPFLNSAVALDKAVPPAIVDALMIVVSGKRFVFPRIIGALVKRAWRGIKAKVSLRACNCCV
eukprot:TRINITY_DN2445_c0_g2_i4.p1 TRINITY_DN2445_c0_g2~~TRINITY_DN2445_c0_g2_i4.p1  ORF type:complete len:586 (-),score=142.27 TRINITY_DN2445_c0_g2_i4:503-2260(-)